MRELTAEGWSSGPIFVAATFRERLVGLLGTDGHGMLLRARSVHGFAMRYRIKVVALDASLKVIACSVLAPWRVLTFWEARWILELPIEQPFPKVGQVLRLG